MESVPLKSVVIEGLYGDVNMSLSLRPGINIIYGRNGTGKTTLLHVLANLVDRDIERFALLRFSRIVVETAHGDSVEIVQKTRDNERAVEVTIRGETVVIEPGSVTPNSLLETLRSMFGGRPVYLPAFRSVLEAVSPRQRDRYYSNDPERLREVSRIVEREDEEEQADRKAAGTTSRNRFFVRERTRSIAYKTLMCRDWFGAFVPTVRFPSIPEVAEELMNEVQTAQLEVARRDNAAFSDFFLQVLTVLDSSAVAPMGGVDEVLSNIKQSLEALQEGGGTVPAVYTELANLIRAKPENPPAEATALRILKVYDDALRSRINAQREAFEKIRTFEGSVNRFLLGKSLKFNPVLADRHRSAKMVDLANGRRSTLSVLSSGERHVITLLFSATHMSEADGILLIDEPELSLHVDWQRIILREIMTQAGDRQILVCTHAPEVTADHRDAMVKLVPEPQSVADPDLLEEEP
jgi:ABC-type Mn2+/Zn2+ transport system ATPase subunit